MRPTTCLNKQQRYVGVVVVQGKVALYVCVCVHECVPSCVHNKLPWLCLLYISHSSSSTSPTTKVLENVINKQQLQIQASNLGQEAQAQRVQAQQHAAAQQEAHAAAQHAAVQAQQHAKLHAEATMQADSIKRVIQGTLLWLFECILYVCKGHVVMVLCLMEHGLCGCYNPIVCVHHQHPSILTPSTPHHPLLLTQM